MEIFNKKPAPKEKGRVGRRPKWTQEFAHMVAQKVVDEKMTYKEARTTFNVSGGAIASWVKQYKNGLLSPEETEQKELNKSLTIHRLEEQVDDLKKEIGDLYLQTRMLKKIVAYSQRKKRENSSVITSENLAQFQKDAE